jgi:hypothetical protein
VHRLREPAVQVRKLADDLVRVGGELLELARDLGGVFDRVRHQSAISTGRPKISCNVIQALMPPPLLPTRMRAPLHRLDEMTVLVALTRQCRQWR